MEHAGDFRKLLHDLHAILVSLPLVDDDGQVQFLCQSHLSPEGLLLDVPGNVLIMIVQTDLTDGLDFVVLFT